MKRIQPERSVLGAFGATVVSLALLVWWTRELRIGWLLAALAAYVVALGLLLRQRRRVPRLPQPLPAALGFLLLALGSATAFSWEFRHAAGSWPVVVAEHEAELGRALSAEMSDVVERAQTAALRAADVRARRRAGADIFAELEQLRVQMRVDALAIYTDARGLIAWAGQHRGPVPASLWSGVARPYFEERPLFSYLYFPVAVPGRPEFAVAAVLVETGVLGDGEQTGISNVVATRTNTRASFRRGGGRAAVWSLVSGPDTIVHARLEPLTQADWRRGLNARTRAIVLLLLALSFVATSVAWVRWSGPHGHGWAVLPLALLVPLAAAAPIADALRAAALFDPILFALPAPGDVTLGRLLAVLLPLGALVAGARRTPRRTQQLLLQLLLGALVVAAAYPLALRLLFAGITSKLPQQSGFYWLGFQVAAVLLLATVTLLVLPRGRQTLTWLQPLLYPPRRRALLATALLLCVAFALFTANRAQPGLGVDIRTASLWAIPYLLAAIALASVTGRGGALLRWLTSGVLAATAVLPHMWIADVDTRIATAEQELSQLGTREDAFLQYLLINFSREAVARFAAGETGVQLLYRTWVRSELARHTYPARIILWSADVALPEVELGSAPPTDSAAAARLVGLVEAVRDQPAYLILTFTDIPSLSKVLTVPLPDRSVITVSIPPRKSVERISPIAPFLSAITAANTRLNLIEAHGTEPQQESVSWHPSRNGWRSEAIVRYPDAWYHAHLSIVLPSLGVRFARAMLLLTFDLALLTLLWVLAVTGRGGSAAPRRAWVGWFGSFRARVTLALFGFFLVPTAVFGWAAYRALSGEVARAAETVARHSVAQAVVEWSRGNTDLRDLAAHAGTDVMFYLNGELATNSSQEAFELGVYNAWMPPHIYQQLESREALDEIDIQQVGNHSYVIAYRALPPAGVLGVPYSLSAGDTPVRQRELAHLVLFAAVVGALLSLALSLAVGRALARPIAQLRRASAAVGAGRLNVQLPERATDEFGQLFAAFNRMTRRLRRARAREVRTVRVLAWGEMARQVAHEIKNPLTPIKLAVQHLRRAYSDRHPQFEEVLDTNVSQILGEIDRLSDIARAFSRYGAPALTSEPLGAVDVSAVVHEALTLYRSGDRAVRYGEEIGADVPRVRARPNELKEVLLNLVENARAALDGTGDIVIRAFRYEDRVEIEVADNGRGISPELLQRVFEPHFSTRSSGTGLGLAIVRRLVESWGGTVSAESDVDVGTIVRIRVLPAE